MSDHQARPRAVYDHTDEDERPGRRRRQAADWGVGDEIFDHMPSRRFARRGEEHEIPRGGVEDGRRTIIIQRDEPVQPPEEPAAVDEAFASREEAIRARRAHDALWGGDEPFADADPDKLHGGEPRGEAGQDEPRQGAAFAWAGRDVPFAEVLVYAPAIGVESSPSGAERPRGGVQGRRTVKIGGRPGELYTASERRRPPRTVHERLGPRPDRIAAYACALGLLLILIAILTQ